MPQPKQYENAAARMSAYRERKQRKQADADEEERVRRTEAHRRRCLIRAAAMDRAAAVLEERLPEGVSIALPEGVSIALLVMIEELAWETQYSIIPNPCTGLGNSHRYELRPEFDQCRFCGVPHVYQHKPTCKIKLLAAGLGVDMENPRASQGDYDAARREVDKANAEYAARREVDPQPVPKPRYQPPVDDDMDDPFSDN